MGVFLKGILLEGKFFEDGDFYFIDIFLVFRFIYISLMDNEFFF